MKVSLSELYDQLEKHDWTYMYSDSSAKWRNGNAEWNRLRGLSIDAGEEGTKLLMAMRHHYLERGTKPERPNE